MTGDLVKTIDNYSYGYYLLCFVDSSYVYIYIIFVVI